MFSVANLLANRRYPVHRASFSTSIPQPSISRFAEFLWRNPDIPQCFVLSILLLAQSYNTSSSFVDQITMSCCIKSEALLVTTVHRHPKIRSKQLQLHLWQFEIIQSHEMRITHEKKWRLKLYVSGGLSLHVIYIYIYVCVCVNLSIHLYKHILMFIYLIWGYNHVPFSWPWLRHPPPPAAPASPSPPAGSAPPSAAPRRGPRPGSAAARLAPRRSRVVFSQPGGFKKCGSPGWRVGYTYFILYIYIYICIYIYISVCGMNNSYH